MFALACGSYAATRTLPGTPDVKSATICEDHLSGTDGRMP
jgi:hypothetical protein